MSLLNRLFGWGAKAPKIEFSAPIAPDRTFFAIGDIHGCIKQLRALFQAIDHIDPAAMIICVGDYVDRGENSAEVLQFLYDQTAQRGDRLVCLRGNHEAMLLSFLEDPEKRASQWLRYGGLQTLASYSVALNNEDKIAMRDALLQAMGPDVLDWLRSTPLSWSTGNVHVTHAGADPALPMKLQSKSALMWGHPEFRKTPRSDGNWIVFGHVIVDEPEHRDGVIAIDTGAYGTGRLTAAQIEKDHVTFHTT